jgi:hypothetical protein
MVGYQEFQKLVGAHACIGANVAPPLHESLNFSCCDASIHEEEGFKEHKHHHLSTSSSWNNTKPIEQQQRK